MTKILVIEDEADLREDLVEELVDEGYDVIWRCNGREGLDAILEEGPDIIICDNLMPVMSGLELLTELRTNHPELHGTPFVFISAHADRKQIATAMDVGATAYLTKPADFDELQALLTKILLSR